MHRGFMWVCISMLAVARRHRPSLMKYFCSQSSNRGYSPFTSLALILLSSSHCPLCNFPSVWPPLPLSGCSLCCSIFPLFTLFSVHLSCSPPVPLIFLYILKHQHLTHFYQNTACVQAMCVQSQPFRLQINQVAFNAVLISALIAGSN